MDTFLQSIQERKTLVTLAIGVVIGLILGLIIAWGLWPVEFINGTPGNLRSDFQRDYILWVAQEYSSTGNHPNDAAWARARLGVEFWEEEELTKTLTNLEDQLSGAEVVRLRALKQAVIGPAEVSPPAETVVGETPQPPSSGGGGLLGPLGTICGVALLVVLLVGGAIFLLRRFRQPQAPKAAERGLGALRGRVPAEPSRAAWGEEGPPLAQYVTSYTLGDDHYDPSFSIEMENGEFMGECGVGISEIIGVGTPSKVTAFEVWLFDKSDIRTVTRVLMSDYAFHDDALKAKLAPKGEPTLVEMNKDVTLETKTLRVRARVVDMTYGQDNLPSHSFFGQMTVELAVWVIEDSSEPGVEDDFDAALSQPL
jgi:hypothetical protein